MLETSDLPYQKIHYLESFLAIANSYERLLRDKNSDSNVIANRIHFFFVGFFFEVNKINSHLITKETPNNLPVN